MRETDVETRKKNIWENVESIEEKVLESTKENS